MDKTQISYLKQVFVDVRDRKIELPAFLQAIQNVIGEKKVEAGIDKGKEFEIDEDLLGGGDK